MAHATADLVSSTLSEQFYALRDWDSLEVKKAQRQSQGVVWDLWPVKYPVNKNVYSAAQTLVRIHNAKCITCSQKITLLPASGNTLDQQGGSAHRGLYSLRSPSKLPVKVHIWQTPGAKIMASRGLQTAELNVVLASFGRLEMNNIKASDICKHYGCWKSRLISKKWLDCVPAQLHRTVHERWWSFNGFPFLRLPFELREMIVRMVIGPSAKPWRGVFSNFRGPGYANQRSSRSNISLASVNKQLYSEVMTTFSLYTTLKIEHGGQLDELFNRCSTTLLKSQPSCKNVRSIELDLEANQLWLLFDMPRDIRVGDSVRLSENNGRITAAFQTWVNECHLRKALINLPHVSHRWGDREGEFIVCQKVFCLRVWAGVRVLLRDVPSIEMGGHIDENQKQNWMQELALERRGIVPDLEGLKEWQQSVWKNW